MGLGCVLVWFVCFFGGVARGAPFFFFGGVLGGGGGGRGRGGQSKEFPIVLHFIPYALANVVLLSPI